MPSLPELEVYVHGIGSEVIGRPIEAVEPLDYRVVRAELGRLQEALVGKSPKSWRRYGKWLMMELGGPEQLIVHLGLTGKLKLIGPEDRRPRYSCFEIRFEDGRRLMMSDSRKLGRIYLGKFEEIKKDRTLGPDLIEASEDWWVATLKRKRRGARDVLLDQHVVAGIGGKYADEILWQARLHPNTKLDSLGEDGLRELYRITLRVVRQAIELDADVEQFPEDWLIPHRRTDPEMPTLWCGPDCAENGR